MSNAIDLIGAKTYTVGDIIINIPTVRQLRTNSKDITQYWKDFGLFMKIPDEMANELDDIGIDFSLISEYDLFVILFLIHKKFSVIENTEPAECTLFANLNLFDLDVQGNVLVDKTGKTVINEEIYKEISDVLCSIICYDKPKKMKWGNEFAKKMWIERSREKKEKAHKRAMLQLAEGKQENHSNMLGGIMLRLVCSGRFPYTFETIQDITVYELFWSLRQLDKDYQVDHLLNTQLVGNDLNKVPRKDLSRFVM